MKSTASFALRNVSGTKDARNLRAQGRIPCIIYGKGASTVSAHLDYKELREKSEDIFANKVFTLKNKEAEYDVVVKSYSVHPMTSKLMHIDLMFADDVISKFDVPLVFVNQSICQAIKFGAVLNIVKRVIPVNCKPCNLPQKLEFDLKNCIAGQSIKLNQITLPDMVKLAVKNKDSVVATIIGKKAKASDTKEETQEKSDSTK